GLVTPSCNSASCLLCGDTWIVAQRSLLPRRSSFSPLLFFKPTATAVFYTLSLHDALPISSCPAAWWGPACRPGPSPGCAGGSWRDRKSTRLNSSHLVISYAVFCLKKKKHKKNSANAVTCPQKQLRVRACGRSLAMASYEHG